MQTEPTQGGAGEHHPTSVEGETPLGTAASGLSSSSGSPRLGTAKRALQFALPVIILGILAVRIDLSAAWNRVSTARMDLLVLSLLLFVSANGFRLVRWALVLNHLEVPASRRETARSFALSLAGGALAGEGLGQFGKVVEFRRGAADMRAVTAGVVIDASHEFLGLLAFTLPAIIVLPLGDLHLSRAVLGGVTVILAGTFVFLLSARGSRLAVRAADFFLRFRRGDRDVVTVLRSIRVREHGVLALVTVSALVLHFTHIWATARGLRIDIALPTLIAVMIVAGLVALIPITIGGLGTREATVVAAFGALGKPAEEALALSLTVFVIMMLVRLLAALYWASTSGERHGGPAVEPSDSLPPP